MENLNEDANTTKQRHGCVTTWLTLIIILNSIIAILYLFEREMIIQNFSGKISNSTVILLAMLGIGNVIFSVLLFKWKKIGFWGFMITGIVALIINLSIGLGIGQSLIGLTGVLILYAILQIRKDNISAWKNLE